GIHAEGRGVLESSQADAETEWADEVDGGSDGINCYSMGYNGKSYPVGYPRWVLMCSYGAEMWVYNPQMRATGPKVEFFIHATIDGGSIGYLGPEYSDGNDIRVFDAFGWPVQENKLCRVWETTMEHYYDSFRIYGVVSMDHFQQPAWPSFIPPYNDGRAAHRGFRSHIFAASNNITFHEGFNVLDYSESYEFA
ncbi:MAG: hypothetical protein WC942_08640, partial [Clostridia bacterium]